MPLPAGQPVSNQRWLLRKAIRSRNLEDLEGTRATWSLAWSPAWSSLGVRQPRRDAQVSRKEGSGGRRELQLERVTHAQTRGQHTAARLRCAKLRIFLFFVSLYPRRMEIPEGDCGASWECSPWRNVDILLRPTPRLHPPLPPTPRPDIHRYVRAFFSRWHFGQKCRLARPALGFRTVPPSHRPLLF